MPTGFSFSLKPTSQLKKSTLSLSFPYLHPPFYFSPSSIPSSINHLQSSSINHSTSGEKNSDPNGPRLVQEMRKPCCEREGGIINKGAWSRQEDEKLIQYIAAHGEGCWRAIPKAAGLLRCGKSCRLRWINYLRPDIKRGNFDHDEEDLIIKLHALLGNRWSLITGRLPGRTDNEVKNYWNSHLKKRLIRMGIDPNNHKPQQHLPRVITSRVLTESSNSMEDASNVPPTCNNNDPHNNTTTNKLVGVGAFSNMVLSCVDDDETSSTPLDLNLDLTIAVTPPCNTQIRVLERKKDGDSSKVIRVGAVEAEDDTSSPTLSLFR